jgi:translocation and assembly module TamB
VESQGSDLRLRGNFSYKKNPGGKDIIERVQVINGAFSMDNNVISFQKLLVSSGPSLLSATGSVDLNRNTLSFSANGASSDMYDLSNPYFRALNGQINFTSNLSGPINDPSLDLKFSSTDIRFLAGNMNIPDILKSHTMLFDSVQGNLNYKKNILVLNNFKAVSGPMIIQLKGKIMFPQSKQLFDIRAPRYDLQASFDNGSLGDLSEIIRGSPSLKGTFHSAFTINGPGEKARASGYFRASNIISKDGYSIDRADAQLTFEAGEFSFRSLSLKKGQGSINAKGMITLDKRYSVNATVNNLDMYDIVPSEWRETMKARTVKTLSLSELTIQGKGNLSDPQLDLTGSLRYRDPEREQSSGYGKVKAEIKGKNVSLTGNFMQGKITISGHASLQGKIPWRANIDFQSARSDFFVALLMKDIPEDLLVNLKGEVRLWGERDSLNAAIMFDKAYLYGYGYGFTNSAPISVKLTDKLLSIDSFNMKNELSELRVGGSIDLGKQYNLTVRGGSSLAPLRAMFKNVDFLKGDASFSLELAGSWEKPRINGRMDVVNGTLGVKNIPHRLSGMNVRIVADGEKIVIEDARGTVSGGDVIMSGSAHLDHLKLRRFFLDINLSNVTISVSKNFWIHFDGKLSYQGNLQNQNITGDIGITKARYTERIDWKSWLLQARKKEALKFDLERLNQTALNVRIRGANLSIDNNLARATAKMDVLIKGTLGNPGLLGRMETTNGIVYFRNNEFNLIKGAIDFARPDEVKPYFNVLAETRIKNYNVRMALDGYLDQFNLALSSTPALEESDIISLLAVGDVSRNLKGMQGGIGAGEATSFLTGKLQDVIEDRLKTVTGVDRLQIDPSVSRTTGTVSPRVTISKRLLADKLYATYSTSADVAEGQIIKLEYLLNKNTSLVGIRDEKGGLGTDIKFRFQFK